MEELLTQDAPTEETPAPEPVDIRGAMRGSPQIPDQREGESFNSFRKRALGAMRGAMQTFASRPTAPVVLPVSPAVAGLVGAWAAAGCPDDFSIDHSVLTAPVSEGLLAFLPGSDGDWTLSPVQGVQGPGIYLMARPDASGGAGRQGLLGELIAAVKAKDFAKAKEIGMQASKAGMSDDDISAAIDEALPDENGAGDLSPAELIAVVSAAGPDRRAKLLPALQSLLAQDPEFLSGEGRHPLRSHLGRIGA